MVSTSELILSRPGSVSAELPVQDTAVIHPENLNNVSDNLKRHEMLLD